MSSYSNAISEGKERAREMLLNAVTKTFYLKPKAHFLSLPASNFAFEEKIRDKMPQAIIDTVERNPKIYYEGIKKSIQLSIRHYQGDIFDHLAMSEKKYDCIWLDLCGYKTPSVMNRLIPVVQGNYTNKEAIVGLTTMNTREVVLSRQKDHYGISNMNEFREKGFIKFLKFFADQTGVKMQQTTFYYQSANNTPMQLLIMKLKKQH